jgi:hypothetical protein
MSFNFLPHIGYEPGQIRHDNEQYGDRKRAKTSAKTPADRKLQPQVNDVEKRRGPQTAKPTPFKESKTYREMESMLLAGHVDEKRLKYLTSVVPAHISQQSYYKEMLTQVLRLPSKAKESTNKIVDKPKMPKKSNGKKSNGKKNGKSNGDQVGIVSRNQSRYSAAPVSLGYQSFKVTGNPLTTRVSKCELLGKVSSTSDAFSPGFYVINAAIPLTFPWLSRVAPSWEYYKFERLSFKYVPTCSTASPGHIFLAVDYDIADTTPTNVTQMDQLQTMSSGSIWSPQVLNVSRAFMNMRNGGYYLTRPGAVPANSDQKNYDVGKFIISTIDAGSTNCGLIYVDYDVILYQQQSNDEPQGDAKLNAVTSATIPFNSGRNQTAGSDPRIFYSTTSPATTIVAMEPGEWLVEWDIVGATTLTAMAMTAGVGSGADAYAIVVPAVFNLAATAGVLVGVYNIPSINADALPSLVFTMTAAASTATSTVRFSPYSVLLA